MLTQKKTKYAKKFQKTKSGLDNFEKTGIFGDPFFPKTSV